MNSVDLIHQAEVASWELRAWRDIVRDKRRSIDDNDATDKANMGAQATALDSGATLIDQLAAAIPAWRPIETCPEGERVMLWLEHGEKGNGEIAVGMVIPINGVIDCYWTWGGPNSGSDIDEAPTMWAPLPAMPSPPASESE